MASHTALCGDEIAIQDDRILVWLNEECRVFDRLGTLKGMVNQEPGDSQMSPGRLSGQHGDWVLGDMGLALWLPHGS